MEGSERTKKQRMAVESLGWLTESSIMPKKHKAIEGVGASSILELKAQLYKSQEEAKKSKDLNPDPDFYRAKKKPLPHVDVFSHKNSGVESRAHKDKLELKALNDGSASYAALEKKAELYNKLVRGELPDEEEKEKYCVDFFRKGIEEDQAEQLPPSSNTYSERLPENENDDTDVLLSAKPVGPGMVGVDNDEHKRFVREVHEEANQAREKASALKLRRQEQATARREKLRQAYLKKRLESLKTAAKTNGS